MTHTEIVSIGPPPERYADRVIGNMMRQLVQDRSVLWVAIEQAMIASRGASSPKAQRRLSLALEMIPGVVCADLTAGKHGRFTIGVYDQTGWSPSADAEIRVGDVIPEKPWIVCNHSLIRSRGRGHNSIEASSRPVVFLTHHALSRMAQRFDLRTAEQIPEIAQQVWNAAIVTMRRMKDWSEIPEHGWRVPLAGKASVVLKRHPTRRALIAATVLEEHEQ